MAERKKESFSPPALGGSSLLVVFAVLALTVFALLSLSTVRADVRLGDAAADSVCGYYRADGKAQEILARLRSGECPAEAELHPEDAWTLMDRYTYTVPISDTQELQVELTMDAEGRYTVLRWQSVPTGDWTCDDSLGLWDGDIIVIE